MLLLVPDCEVQATIGCPLASSAIAGSAAARINPLIPPPCALPASRLHEVMDGVGRALKAGKLVYWICPLVEESEAEGTDHLTNATQRFETLQKRFGDKVGLVHGQMKGPDKDHVMAQFSAHEIGLLVATTVVEVGVDVPAATIMVIENAERFGLAQLHQLRGRIGRGSEASTCLLLYREPLN